MPIDPQQVVHIMMKEFGVEKKPKSDPSREETETAISLISILKDACAGLVDFIHVSEALEIDTTREAEEWSAEDEYFDTYPEKSFEEFVSFGWHGSAKIEQVLDAAEYLYKADGSRRKLSQMQHIYPFIQNEHHMDKLAHVHKDGRARIDRRAGLVTLKTRLLAWVKDRLEHGIELHDIDLQTQAIKINRNGRAIGREDLVPDFKASLRWIQMFKKAHRIVSRKVTRFVARKVFENEEDLKEKAGKFVEDTRHSILKHRIPIEAIFNADQMGIDYELHSNRSLAEKCEQVVERVAQSASSLTHSYTVLPLIGKDGSMGEKLFVVLAEPNGRFPAGVTFPSNLEVRASKSHIMGTELTKEWLIPKNEKK